jgi:putative phage-type endonuclease
MDEDYVYESTETESTDISIDSVESVIADADEDDIFEVMNMINHEIDDYYKERIIELISPSFYKTMVEYITHTTFITLLSLDLSDDNEEDYEIVSELVEQMVDVYAEFSNIPKRSISFTADISPKTPEQISVLKDKIRDLQNIILPKQKTKEWYEMRHGLITASNIYKVFGSESVVNSLIYEKCKPLVIDSLDNYRGNNTNTAMHWGNKYEPVTVMIYEAMFHTKIGEFGCIPHQRYPFVGASPDGINIDPMSDRFGRMLEIKNIVNREITGIPKEEYWPQTQMQMEVCDLEECDFVETRFLEYGTEEDFNNDNSHEYKGVILHFIEKPELGGANKNTMPVYRYMPLDTLEIYDWIAEQKTMERQNNLVLFTKIYWYLEDFSCVCIPRNRFWFEAAIPKIRDIWDIILKERVDGYEHRAAKKRIFKPNVICQDASNSYIINNMPLANKICLVKLDAF